MTTRTEVYLGLGSNLADPMQQIRQAIGSLNDCLAELVVAHWYRSEPLGPSGQPHYINTVVRGLTALSPLDLLDCCQAIEHAQHRTRTLRWGPRTLDIDLLFYGSLVIDHPRLTIPHPHWNDRAFVAFPLLDLIPRAITPTGDPIDLTRYDSATLNRIPTEDTPAWDA